MVDIICGTHTVGKVVVVVDGSKDIINNDMLRNKVINSLKNFCLDFFFRFKLCKDFVKNSVSYLFFDLKIRYIKWNMVTKVNHTV